MEIIPVILSGGYGTRLWPLSRKQYPKQYLSLADKKSMLQLTVDRLKGLNGLEDPIVICNIDHRFIVAEQLQQQGIKQSTILLEPVGRNSAPAIAAAAYHVSLGDSVADKDSILLILSVDHIIQDVKAFHQAINIAAEQAKTGKIAIFGVTPTTPNTGYGYIKTPSTDKKYSASTVESFIEKPKQDMANKYINDGNYLWNSGMFMFKAETIIEELYKYSDNIMLTAKKSIDESRIDLDFIRLDEVAFKASPSDSIDCAVMEKTDKAVVVKLDSGWNDVGSWEALYDIGNKDINNNVIKGDKVITEDVTNCYINADHHMVAAIGIDDLVIVDTPDVTLVAKKERAQDIAMIVKKLEENNDGEQETHRKVFRPWGWYDSIDFGERFHVKRINVKPKASLSLQRHKYRSEHWVIIKGSAKVTNNKDTFILSENESTYIQIGHKHRLENLLDTDLELIEVQSGSYFGEDDIERFDDDYGREENMQLQENIK